MGVFMGRSIFIYELQPSTRGTGPSVGWPLALR